MRRRHSPPGLRMASPQGSHHVEWSSCGQPELDLCRSARIRRTVELSTEVAMRTIHAAKQPPVPIRLRQQASPGWGEAHMRVLLAGLLLIALGLALGGLN